MSDAGVGRFKLATSASAGEAPMNARPELPLGNGYEIYEWSQPLP
jgi:hypothetical protein